MTEAYELVDTGTLETAARVVLVIYMAAIILIIKFLLSTRDNKD